jgi:glutamate-1-semialdehyde 2,1-aminomutase
VDEALVALLEGIIINNPYSMGPLLDNPEQMTRVIEFNDIDALEKALSPQDIACVLAEPAMTDVGIIHPEPGYHATLRELTRRFGTLLILDETHCLCAGPAGLTGELGLETDMLVLGKAIAAGFPAAVLGLSQEIGDKLNTRIPWQNFFGFGGTLSGNATAVTAIKAALEHVITQSNYDRMIPLEGIDKIIKDADLPWYVARLGCRVEFRFRATQPKNGREALFEEDVSNQGDLLKDGLTGPLEKLIHIYLANRGILLSPYHDMALISPETTSDDVDYYLKTLAECVNELIA